VIIFLDTEFTDLVIKPQLLSVGMVASSGAATEFYAEVTDRRRIHAASWFALDVVLPQFGKIAHASCSYATLGARLGVFIERVIASQTDRGVEIAFSYDLDWELAERAMRDSDGAPRESTMRELNPRNVYDIVGFGAGKRAAEAYFAGQSEAPISRHHSLCDARALRVAYEAANKPPEPLELGGLARSNGCRSGDSSAPTRALPPGL
jgi:hypothetical protein